VSVHRVNPETTPPRQYVQMLLGNILAEWLQEV